MTELEMFEQFKVFLQQQESSDVSETPKAKKKTTKKNFKRRPKGSGTYYKLSGTRRKPWVACVTVGYNEETGRQEQRVLGYFKTDTEAQTALSVYSLQAKGIISEDATNLISVSRDKVQKVKVPTFKEIWDIIFEEEVSKRSVSTQKNYKTAFNHLKELHPISVSNINLHTLQPVFDKFINMKSGYSKLNNIKQICNMVFNYAIKYDYVEKNYANFIKYESIKKEEQLHIPFTHDEIERLWKHNSSIAELVLIYIYTGLRPIELISIKTKNIFLEEKYMIGGLKTNNGKDRVIPLHNDIIPLIKKILDKDGNFLLCKNSASATYIYYNNITFKRLMSELKMKHLPYDARHTFATLCNEYGLNEFLVKKMMGHSSRDLTKDVYTHATIDRLVDEVNKLPTQFVSL